jgi:hypothetical protein
MAQMELPMFAKVWLLTFIRFDSPSFTPMQSSIIHIQGRAQQYPLEGIGMTNEVLHFICDEIHATAVK